MAGALPYMQLYPADYLADTAHLSTLEHGAYLLLMFNYWQRGECFRAKDEQTLNKRLAIVARLSSEDWEQVKDNLQEFFNVVVNDSEIEWRHERIERDLAAVQEKSEKAKRAGKLSAESRRSKSVDKKKDNVSKTDDKQPLSERSTDDKQKLNHTEAEAEEDIDTEHISTTSAMPESKMFEEFLMFPDWLPKSKSWDDYIKINGLTEDEVTGVVFEESIREFVSHWITSPKPYTQSKWEHKLAQAIVKKRRFTEANQNATSKRSSKQSSHGKSASEPRVPIVEQAKRACDEWIQQGSNPIDVTPKNDS